MKVEIENSLSDLQIVEILNKNGISANLKSILFSGKQIQAVDKGMAVMIKNKGTELIIEIVVPIWVRIVALVSSIIITSLVLTAITGDVVVVNGGFIVILLGLFIGDAIYKSTKSDELNDFCNSISAKLKI
jgi:hypothetical protein